MKRIILTKPDGSKVRININNIDTYERNSLHNNKSYIVMGDNDLLVEESPEQIDQILDTLDQDRDNWIK